MFRTSYSLMVLMAMVAPLRAAEEPAAEEEKKPPLRIATFEIDATPPVGTPLAYGPAVEIVDPLSARGIVLWGNDQPIVLCAVDWIGIANEAHDAWRRVLAEAAGTSVDRVAVHVLHQHDAPRFDLTTEQILSQHGMGGQMIDEAFVNRTFESLTQAVREAVSKPIEVTHLALGRARVDRVASNRRILGSDGRVEYVRFSSCRIPEAIAAPVGVIDPYCKLVGFWKDNQPVASLTYYATHPQSYYGEGGVSCDFVGLARNTRDRELSDVAHIHFNGAGGNIAAGKYNDGSPENRPLLAERLADGMRRAWQSVDKMPISADDLKWKTVPVALPVRDTLVEAELQQRVIDESLDDKQRWRAATDLAFLRRMQSGHQIELSCLRLGPADLVHMPGELFVEYQLAAQEMRGDRHVCMAAYGDYGPGYIGTQVSYGQGGYETGPPSRTAPEVEEVLTVALEKLLAD